MQLREDKTMQSAVIFVGLVTGLCAVSMFVSRIHGVLWTLKPGLFDDRIFWILAAGVVYSGMLVGAAFVLIVRPQWLLAVFGYTSRHRILRLGDAPFWRCCVRAVGVSSAVFGAAWFGHAVFWYRSTLPPAGFGNGLMRIRWEFVGAGVSMALGGVLALSPQTVASLFYDASHRDQPDAAGLCDRRLLRDLIWSAAVFAFMFRLMWIARFVSWSVENAGAAELTIELVCEFVAACFCAWLAWKSEWLASRLHSHNSYCIDCGLEQLNATVCPECQRPMLAQEVHTESVPLRGTEWQVGWVRIAALATLGWFAAVTASRGSIMLSVFMEIRSGQRAGIGWSTLNAAGAPMLFFAALFVLAAPRTLVKRSDSGMRTDTLRATGLRVTALALVAQSFYLVFFPISYAWRAVVSPGGPGFYPSGVVSTVQLAATVLLAWYLFRMSKRRVRKATSGSGGNG